MAREIKPRGNVENLPKWAQRYINRLTREIERHNEQHDPEARIFWLSFPDDTYHGIPEQSLVAFRTDSGKVNLTLQNGTLYVQGDSRLKIVPVSSNVIRVALDRLIDTAPARDAAVED